MSYSLQQIKLQAKAELERRKRLGLIQEEALEAPEEWQEWVKEIFPKDVSGSFAQRHIDLMCWIWAIKKGIRPPPFIAIWPRGGGKTTLAELSVVAIGARDIRAYVWYVRETQDQADINVMNIMDLLESSNIERYYPLLGAREIGKFGRPRAWRRNQLRTASGLTVDAIGFDTAVRGAKIKTDRPGYIILDDIDNKKDDYKVVTKKIQTLTTSILPSGSPDVAILGIQNLMINHGIFSMLAGIAEEKADFLINRIVSGPFPAIDNLDTEQQNGKQVIVGGTPTWDVQNLKVCQEDMDTWGYTSFMQEAQHEVEIVLGGIWNHIEFRRCDLKDVPDLVRGAVWCDPAVTSTDKSSNQGIVASGIGEDDIIYRLFAWEQIDTPEGVIKKAILKCFDLGFTEIGIETDQGGDVWRPAYKQVWNEMKKNGDVASDARMPKFRQAKAGAGHGSKIHRNQRMLLDYEQGRVVHVRGTHLALEKALKRFPIKPLDLADAAFWDWFDLRHRKKGWSRGMG